ncbi:hypothetical protein LINPERPRIM_LOCUS26458 [Linum perenne]
MDANFHGLLDLQMYCLDMVDLEGLSAPTAPTCGYWDDGRVSNAVQMMKAANAHKYEEDMRAETRVQRSMARSDARKKTRAARKKNNKA